VHTLIDDDVPPAKLSRGRGQRGRTPLDGLGLVVFAASTAIHCARIDLLVGNLSAAEEELRRAYEALASITEKYLLSPIAELLAEVVCAQGRFDEAEEISRAAEELSTSDDVGLQALWPAARGTALPWQERADEAERRAREAVDLIRTRAALSRLTTWVSQNAAANNQHSASDRRAGHANQRAVPTVPGLTRELLVRDILANTKLSDSHARTVALETLDMPEELFAQMMTLSGTAEPAPSVPEGLIREEVAASKLTELQRVRSEP
jgi:ATP/maltotriose-dependent transcriptional regulator MalT